MANKKSDATKKAIENQFIDLLKEKNISDIKVTEITDALDLHRTTFYKYYDSVYDLAEEIEKRLFTVNRPAIPGNIAHDNLRLVTSTGSEKYLSTLLENTGREPAFDARISKLRKADLLEIINKMPFDYRQEDQPFFTTFILNGIPGLVQWVLSDECTLPIEVSSHVVDQLLVQSLMVIHELLKAAHEED